MPLKTIQLLADSLSDTGEKVQVAIDKNGMSFRTARATIHTKLMAGKFAPYRMVIPRNPAHKILIPVQPFLSCVRQVSVMADGDLRRVGLTFSDNSLTMLASNNADHGSGEIAMPVPYEGRKLSVSLDPKFVIEMLRAVAPATDVLLGITDSNNPVLFRAGDDYLHSIIPLDMS